MPRSATAAPASPVKVEGEQHCTACLHSSPLSPPCHRQNTPPTTSSSMPLHQLQQPLRLTSSGSIVSYAIQRRPTPPMLVTVFLTPYPLSLSSPSQPSYSIFFPKPPNHRKPSFFPSLLSLFHAPLRHPSSSSSQLLSLSPFSTGRRTQTLTEATVVPVW